MVREDGALAQRLQDEECEFATLFYICSFCDYLNLILPLLCLFVIRNNYVNPLTLMSDQDSISPYNIITISTR